MLWDEKRSVWLSVAALTVVLVVAAAVRLFDLDRQTLTHPEAYTPGLDFPYDLSEPRPRPTLVKVLTGSIGQEPHPPAYYLVMLPWTKAFGTSLVAMRLPSVLFGVGSVLLVFLLGWREGGKAAGLVAATMLALSGHHVLYSQTAKMYAMACFFGLLSTVLLLRLTRETPRPRLLLFLYGAATVTGLATLNYVWPVFLLQILWVAAVGLGRPAVPQLLRWQLAVFLLASPLCAVVAYQARVPSHVIENALWFLSNFMQLGFLFESAQRPDTTATLIGLGLGAATLILLAAGLTSARPAREEGESSLPEPPRWLLVPTAAVAVVGILAFAAVTQVWVSNVMDGRTTHLIVLTALVPVGLVLLAYRLPRHWARLHDSSLGRTAAWLAGRVSLSGLVAVVPAVVLLAVSPKIQMLASRGFLVYTPFLFVVAATGLVALVRRGGGRLAVGLVAGAALAAALPLSVYHFYHQPNSPRDYKALAARLEPRMQETDLLFIVPRDWQTTPLFYYLKADRYHYVGHEYARELANHPYARVWVVTWHDEPPPPEIADALHDYRSVDCVEVRGGRAALYQQAAN